MSTSGGHQDLQPTGASSFQSAVDNVVIIDDSLNLLPHTGSPREPCVDLTLSPQGWFLKCCSAQVPDSDLSLTQLK